MWNQVLEVIVRFPVVRETISILTYTTYRPAYYMKTQGSLPNMYTRSDHGEIQNQWSLTSTTTLSLMLWCLDTDINTVLHRL